jgi:hypothetical protein
MEIIAQVVNTLAPASTIKDVIVRVIECVDKFPDMTGPEKRDSAIDLLRTIAKGRDGVTGTADDIIPVGVLDALQNVIDTNIIGDMIDLVVDATKGKFDINSAKEIVKDARSFSPFIMPVISFIGQILFFRKFTNK